MPYLKNYRLPHLSTCASKNIVYVAFCGCPKYYVGSSTRSLKIHAMEHKSRLKNKILDVPMVEHCLAAQPRFEDLKFFVIYKYENQSLNRQDIKKILLCKENFWIHKLHSLTPEGMNQAMDLSCHL